MRGFAKRRSNSDGAFYLNLICFRRFLPAPAKASSKLDRLSRITRYLHGRPIRPVGLLLDGRFNLEWEKSRRCRGRQDALTSVAFIPFLKEQSVPRDRGNAERHHEDG